MISPQHEAAPSWHRAEAPVEVAAGDRVSPVLLARISARSQGPFHRQLPAPLLPQPPPADPTAGRHQQLGKHSAVPTSSTPIVRASVDVRERATTTETGALGPMQAGHPNPVPLGWSQQETRRWI